MDKIGIWHNTRGIANQYFVYKGNKVLFQIPNWLGKILTSIKKPQKEKNQ